MRIARRIMVAVVMTAGLAVSPAAAAEPAVTPGAIVINELAAGAYVELRNVSQSTVDIGGFNLWLCGANAVVSSSRVAIGRLLGPGGFYVFAASSFTGAAVDQVYPGTLPSGGVVLLDPAYRWVDGVATIADSPCGAGNPAPTCPQSATARDSNSTNTHDNGADFSCRTSTPGEPND